MSTSPFRPRYFLPGLLSATVPVPVLDPQSSPLAQPGNGPIAGFTNTFGLNLVNFDWITWHNYEWENWIVVDALLNAAIGFLNIKGFWKPDTEYLAGQSVFDPANVSMLYLCLAPHTSGTDFDAEKPLYWRMVDQAKPPVSSVFGRIGDVIAAAGDYAAFYANKATTEAHIARIDNPHGTSWGNLIGKPVTFPPSAHTHVEADITNLDKYTKAEVNTIANMLQIDINTRLPKAGGTMTGALLLSTAITQPKQAVTKEFVEQLIEGVGAATHVGDTPPTDLEQGRLWYRTREPAGLFMWFIDADTSQWIQVAGAGGSDVPPPPVDASVFVSATPPPFPTAGRLWFSTVEPVGLFIWYEDGDSDQWVQIGGSNGAVTDGTPIGTVSFFAADTAPRGWLICNNQVVTTAYPELRQYLLDAGSPYGVSGADPLVPELRGEFIRGHVGGRTGVDDGRVFGSLQLDQLQRLMGNLNDIQTLGGAAQTVGVIRRNTPTSSAIWQGATAVNRNTRFDIDTAIDPTVRSGAETRPRNIALLPCIKAFDTLRVESSANFNLATTEQARAGTSTDTLMSPALVRAVSGDVILDRVILAGTNYSLFVPPEFDGIELEHEGLIPLTDAAAPILRVGTGAEGAPVYVSAAQYNQSILFHNTGAPLAISNTVTGFQCGPDIRIASGGVVQGRINLRRMNGGSAVYFDARYRGSSVGASGAFQQAQVDGFMGLAPGPYTHIVLFASTGAGFSQGRVTVRGKR